jgi:hypothetical protein
MTIGGEIMKTRQCTEIPLHIKIDSDNWVEVNDAGRAFCGEFANKMSHHYNKFVRDNKYNDTDELFLTFFHVVKKEYSRLMARGS